MEAQGYIVYVGVGKPILKVTDAGWLVLKGKAQVQAREALTIQTTVKTASVSENDTELFEALRELRAKIAQKRGVPAFVIFSDSALHDMCLKTPTTDEEFLTVNGVGETKLKQYGEQFMNVIREHRKASYSNHNENDNQLPEYIEKKRAEGFSSAYEKWTDAEIDRLKTEFMSGISIKELTEIHGRTQGAIRSRLKKENLID